MSTQSMDVLAFLVIKHSRTEIASRDRVPFEESSSYPTYVPKISTYPKKRTKAKKKPPLQTPLLPPFPTGFTTALPAPLNLPNSTSNTPLFLRPHSSLLATSSSIALAAFRFWPRASFNRSMMSLKPSRRRSPHSSYWSMGREAKKRRARWALSLWVLSG
jgi:hypothetical protein